MSEGPPERLGGRVAEWRKGFGQEEGAAPREPESAAGVRERDREEKGTVRTGRPRTLAGVAELQDGGLGVGGRAREDTGEVAGDSLPLKRCGEGGEWWDAGARRRLRKMLGEQLEPCWPWLCCCRGTPGWRP